MHAILHFKHEWHHTRHREAFEERNPKAGVHETATGNRRANLSMVPDQDKPLAPESYRHYNVRLQRPAGLVDDDKRKRVLHQLGVARCRASTAHHVDCAHHQWPCLATELVKPEGVLQEQLPSCLPRRVERLEFSTFARRKHPHRVMCKRHFSSPSGRANVGCCFEPEDYQAAANEFGRNVVDGNIGGRAREHRCLVLPHLMIDNCRHCLSFAGAWRPLKQRYRLLQRSPDGHNLRLIENLQRRNLPVVTRGQPQATRWTGSR